VRQIFGEPTDAVFEYRFFIENRYYNFERQAPIARCHAWNGRGGESQRAMLSHKVEYSSAKNR
jgi:hypothetical protein